MFHRQEALPNWEARLKRLRTPYKKISYGSTIVLDYYDRKNYFVGNIGDKNLAGMHIIPLLKNHLLKNIDNLTYNTRLRDSDLFYTWWHKENAERLIKKEIGMMDINNCYWETAKILGYLDDNLYKIGYRKVKEYKKARNISIGALNTAKMVFEYNEEGILIKKYPVPADERLKAIRRTIINFVGQFSLAAMRQFPNDIFMYKTDCFYYNKNIEKQLHEFITDHGHTSKKWIGDLIKVNTREESAGGELLIYDYKDIKFKTYSMSGSNEVNEYLEFFKDFKF
jgi:hypothetical protein